MFEFIFFCFVMVVARWAWLARGAAHRAAEKARQLEQRLVDVEGKLRQLERTATHMPDLSEAAQKAPAPDLSKAEQEAPAPGHTETMPAPAKAAPITPPAEAYDDRAADAFDMAEVPAQPTPAASAPAATPRPQVPTPAWLLAARRWFLEGNPVAKVGLLILFIGVSFLLKYAAARVTVPIELRLAGIVLADLGALAWAWRSRRSHPTVSLPLQGTCMAVLMLVTFGAFRLYHLIPGGLTFALLFLLTLGTCLLAVLQNTQWLAIFGIAGGFAAPILASSGGGSHIALFSYYALLNAGVLAIALKRSWRILNLLGFAFTFAIGTAWGVLRYEPENYASVQGFLILFFLYYVGVAVAYARLQAPRLRHYVDATLVFGTPMLAASLQYPLVNDMEFGLAYSALAVGLFYGGLSLLLARRRAMYGMLVDAFTALAVVFATLAIPFALDGRWTSAAWALEGAGIVWIGLRQRRPLAWGFGLFVQLSAWVTFVGSVVGLDPQAAMTSNLWLGFLLLAASAFLMATRFRAGQEGEAHLTGVLSAMFLLGASIWLLAGAWTEIILRTQATLRANLMVASALACAFLLAWIARRMRWALAGKLALLTQLLAGTTLFLLWIGSWRLAPIDTRLFETPFIGGMMILAASAITAWLMQRQDDGAARKLSQPMLAWSGLWWFLMVAPTVSNWLLANYLQFKDLLPVGQRPLQWPAYCLLIAACTPLLLLLTRRLAWPALRWSAVPAWGLFLLSTIHMLGANWDALAAAEFWFAFGALWLLNEWLMRHWQQQGWPLREAALRLLHTVRTSGPWLLIWPVASYWITVGLAGMDADRDWAILLPAWLMMGSLAWVMRRAQADAWPATPIASWYRFVLAPLGVAWSILLVAGWNLTRDGAMAPLPYLPLANPLDISSIFAILLAVACYRQLRERLTPWRQPLRMAGVLAAYGWFNLVLLRSVSHYRDLPYQAGPLFASQFVQAMFSLVWSVTALLLMRHATRSQSRQRWLAGAVLLGVVVLKLFLVDLSNVGGVERIISFLGVGALMVGIGYLAPYPSSREETTQAEVA